MIYFAGLLVYAPPLPDPITVLALAGIGAIIWNIERKRRKRKRLLEFRRDEALERYKQRKR